MAGVQPGNSAGPLLDDFGNVVGVIAAELNGKVALSLSSRLPENVNFALKSSYLLSFLGFSPEVIDNLAEPKNDSSPISTDK